MTIEIRAKLSKLTIKQVKEMAILLFTDYREGAEDALDWALEYLEQEMQQEDFIAFCKSF